MQKYSIAYKDGVYFYDILEHVKNENNIKIKNT